jgi:hypothetical protein
MSRFIQLFHIIAVGSLFLYVGIVQTEMPSLLFTILLGLGVLIVFYHIYKAILRLQTNKSYWINLLHILIIGPLMAYIGYYGAETERKYFEIMLMFGFAVIGYHGYYLLVNILQ